MNWIERIPYHHLRNFTTALPDGQLNVLVGQEPIMLHRKGWHLSISHTSRLPTWNEIKDARYRFCPDEAHMAMILPPKAEYVNVHPTTMHLYEVPA